MRPLELREMQCRCIPAFSSNVVIKIVLLWLSLQLPVKRELAVYVYRLFVAQFLYLQCVQKDLLRNIPSILLKYIL